LEAGPRRHPALSPAGGFLIKGPALLAIALAATGRIPMRLSQPPSGPA
jgi:hypothetical protein